MAVQALQSHESQMDNGQEGSASKHGFTQTFSNPIKPAHITQDKAAQPHTRASMNLSVQDLGITSQDLAIRLQDTIAARARNLKVDSQTPIKPQESSSNIQATATRVQSDSLTTNPLTANPPATDSHNKTAHTQNLDNTTPHNPTNTIKREGSAQTTHKNNNTNTTPNTQTTKTQATQATKAALTQNINTQSSSTDSRDSCTQDSHTTKTRKPQPDKPLFQKTQALLQQIAECSIFDHETLQKGMKIDLSKGDSEFFELYIGAQLHYACAYIYVLDERSFAKKDSPDLHFMRCDSIKKVPQELIKVCVPTKNAFDYRVRSSGIDTRLFYEHPLRVCPSCIALLCQILSAKHKRTIMPNQIKEDEILGLLFKNKLKNLIL